MQRALQDIAALEPSLAPSPLEPESSLAPSPLEPESSLAPSSLEPESPTAPHSVHALCIALFSILALFIVTIAFIIAPLVATGEPWSSIAQAFVSITLCVVAPFGVTIYNALNDLNAQERPQPPLQLAQSEPTRLQSFVQSEQSENEKTPEHSYGHALNAFKQALETDLVDLKDYFEHQLQAHTSKPNVQSCTTAAYNPVLHTV